MIIGLIAEPMLGRYGAPMPVILLVREFSKRGEVIVVSSVVKPEVRRELEVYAYVVDLGFRNVMLSEASTSFVEYWLREATLRQLSRRYVKFIKAGLIPETDVIINTSNTIAVPSTAWYAQGPVFEAMDNAYPYFPLRYRFPYRLMRKFVRKLDLRLMRRLRRLSKVACANSYAMKRVYESLGIDISCVIYEPLDIELFKPTTSKPSGDYVLTYFGKETDYITIKGVADRGVKIKAFGSKAASIVPRYVLKHPNIEVLGYVADEELVDLYSNALFTLFPFTEEPFGYIPVESMACGTPVLTYNKQGPSETVVNGVTGWLANGDDELIELAVRLWREGYPSWMRSRCRERALEFDVKAVAERWLEVVNTLLTGKATWHNR